MKKILSSILFLAFGLGALVSCQEDPIMTFGDENYLHFKEEKDSKKVYRFSFALALNVPEYEYSLPLTLIGKVLDTDKEYKVEVVTEGENASTISEASYKLPSECIFSKGVYEDVLKVTLINTPELAEEKLLVLRIAENGNFKPGPKDWQTAKIYVSNRLSQPAWWDTDMETTLLGPYSDIKFSEFIRCTGVTDLSGVETTKIVAYVESFIYYLRALDLKGETVYEADNKTPVLASIPYALRF